MTRIDDRNDTPRDRKAKKRSKRNTGLFKNNKDYQVIYEKGNRKGYNEGRTQGYELGHTEGFDKGVEYGKGLGYTEAKKDMYNTVYSKATKDYIADMRGLLVVTNIVTASVVALVINLI